MMYSSGIEGTSGFEFWGSVDHSFFTSPTQLFGWNDCSPSMGCMYSTPSAMCSVTTQGSVRARVPSDWPTDLATLTLNCPGNQLIKSIEFASFGNPAGSCESGFSLGSCHKDNATIVVQQLCTGKHVCVVPTTPQLYGGDVCPQQDWPVSLAVDVKCG